MAVVHSLSGRNDMSSLNQSHRTPIKFRHRLIPSVSFRLHPSSSISICISPRAAQKLSSSSPRNRSAQRGRNSISLCTNPNGVDVVELSALLASNQHNCEQCPVLLKDGSITPVNPAKLRRALRHSTVVVALYLYVEDLETGGAEFNGRTPEPSRGWLDCWLAPRPFGQKTLVAFGRATSDVTLTASIYDLVVAPYYQRLGYGSRVLLKIVHELRRMGIFDIASTPATELRPFFEHCGFEPDKEKSITMMYTRGPSVATESSQIKDYGRKSLLIPPPLGALKGDGIHHLCKN